jgi:hypothetical protein
MFAGVSLFGSKWYLIIKIITAGIVLMWNYAARKALIFRGEKHEQQ